MFVERSPGLQCDAAMQETPARQGVAALADIESIERQPLGALGCPPSTYALFQRSAARHANRIALSFFFDGLDPARTHDWSYADLLDDITRTANLFHAHGVGAGDVVAFVLPNLPETHMVLWGGEAAGIAFALNPLLEPEQIAGLLAAAGAKLLVTLAPVPGFELWSRLSRMLRASSSLCAVLLVDVARYLPGRKRLALRAWRLAAAPRAGRLRVPVRDFHAALAQQSVVGLHSRRRIAPADISSYFCTGGTTGAPKIALRTHANEIADTWQVASINGPSFAPGKSVFCGLPLFHVNGALVTGLVPFSLGGRVVLGTPQGYRGEGVVRNFWNIVETHRINFFSGVPTLYSALLQVPPGAADLSTLEYALCGAAPMPAEVMRAFEQSTGVKVLEGYGLTEGTCVSACNPPQGERRIGSIGLRLPWQQMKAVALDGDGAYLRDCAVDEVGAIAMRGPNVFAGYRDPAHERGLWIDTGDGGGRWLNTGDLGRQDADGYFWLTGRRKELIIRGGHNIDPAAIEEPLHRHPAVALCAAVGRPDAHAGEVPVAYVQLKPGASADEAALLEYAAQRITERAAVPKRIRIVESLPLTAVGKIFKPELRGREIVDVVETLLDTRSGLRRLRVDLRQDPRLGATVRVEAAGRAEELEALRRALGVYTFGFDVVSGGKNVNR